MNHLDYAALIQRLHASGVETEPAILRAALEGFVEGRDWVIHLYGWDTGPDLQIGRLGGLLSGQTYGVTELADGQLVIAIEIGLFQRLKGTSLERTPLSSTYALGMPVKTTFTIRQYFEGIGVQGATHWLQGQGCPGLAPLPSTQPVLPAGQAELAALLQPPEQEAVVLRGLFFRTKYGTNPLEPLEALLQVQEPWLLAPSTEQQAPGISGVLKVSMEYRKKLQAIKIHQLTLRQQTLPDLLHEVAARELVQAGVHVGTVDAQLAREGNTWTITECTVTQLFDMLAGLNGAEWVVDDAGGVQFLVPSEQPLCSSEQLATGTVRARLRFRQDQPHGTLLLLGEQSGKLARWKYQLYSSAGEGMAQAQIQRVKAYRQRKYLVRLDGGERLWLDEVELASL